MFTFKLLTLLKEMYSLQNPGILPEHILSIPTLSVKQLFTHAMLIPKIFQSSTIFPETQMYASYQYLNHCQ